VKVGRRSSAAGSRENQAEELAPKHVTAFLVGLSSDFLSLQYLILSIQLDDVYAIIHFTILDILIILTMF
jgi:hypothetical protein